MAICASTMSFFLVFLIGFVCSSHAHNHVFHVGEHDGWTLKPSENYSHWAQRNRFQINDELVFKYRKGDDSVLVVGEDEYNKCNKRNPIQTLINDDGYSKFKFDRSGPFFFISGHDQNCDNGQKLIVVVLADHHRRHHPPSSAPSPSPAAKPSPSPTAKTPAHAPHVKPPSHSPPSHAPPLSHSPSPSPSPIAKPPSHAPPLLPPSHSPSPATKPTPPPSHSPSPSPTAIIQIHAPPVNPPSPAKTPAHAPPIQPPPVPVSHHSPPPEVESPENTDNANPPVFLPPHHAPAPAPSSASDFGASFILSVGLGVVATIISAWIVV